MENRLTGSLVGQEEQLGIMVVAQLYHGQWLWGMESSSNLLNLRVRMTAVAEELDVVQIKEKQRVSGVSLEPLDKG